MMWKRTWSAILLCGMSLCLVAGASGCSRGQQEPNQTEIQVFIAASLNQAMTELARQYQDEHPEVQITLNADSSGTLLAQLREGYECDLFFSAAQKQMDELEGDGLVVPGTRTDLLKNQLVLVSRKDSGTKVTSLENLNHAKSIALAGGSVPAGRYTRMALINLGILPEREDPSSYTTKEISDFLDGVEISEQDNVSKVLTAVAESSCEVGTTYYSDLYGFEGELEVLEQVGEELTGAVTYPIACVQNPEADQGQTEAAEDFLSYLLSEQARTVFERYYFGWNEAER